MAAEGRRAVDLAVAVRELDDIRNKSGGSAHTSKRAGKKTLRKHFDDGYLRERLKKSRKEKTKREKFEGKIRKIEEGR